jgi:hypothetical protein
MSQGIRYDVDLVLCIDTTGSMGDILDRVKERAVRLHEDLTRAMAAKDKGVDQLRIRVVAFGDYSYDGDNSMRESSFFVLPAQAGELESFVRGLTLVSGGDAPESGQEALAFAMRSPWAMSGDKNRQVIVVWSDASTHELQRAAGQPNYPAWMPANLSELTDWWEGQTPLVDAYAKRLLLFTPDGAGWSEIAANWEQVVHVQTRAGEGLHDQDYDGVLATIAESV